MSVTYRYKCSVENTVVYEVKTDTDPEPTTCINDGAALVAGSLAIYSQPMSLGDMSVRSNAKFDFNNCVVTDLSHGALANVGTQTHDQIDAHITNATIHRSIDDAGTATTELWSANKISTELATKVDGGANLTGEQGLYSAVSGTQLQLKSLNAGTNITLDADANAVTINATTTPFTWQGTWTSQNYAEYDVVHYNGAAYVCILDTVASENPTNTTYWNLLAAKGDTGAVGPAQLYIGGSDASTKSPSYISLIKGIFPGSATFTLSNIDVVTHMDNGVTSHNVRIFDVTNANVIAEKTGITATSVTKTNMGTLSNVPTAQAIFELQMKCVGATGNKLAYARGMLLS